MMSTWISCVYRKHVHQGILASQPPWFGAYRTGPKVRASSYYFISVPTTGSTVQDSLVSRAMHHLQLPSKTRGAADTPHR